jgi:protein-S-isoprenylcysteine O-methyltransferase Ste14
MLQVAAIVEVLLCWVVWSAAFFKPSRQSKGQQKVVRAPASRWGILLQTIGFACAWMYVRPDHFAKSTPALIAAIILAPLAVALAWSAARHLGKQWRYEAALSKDHELIRTGPYKWIRHPIYASMLGLLLATLAAWTWWPMAIAAVLFFLAGTEVRIHAEERLLSGRFPTEYAQYKKTTSAYIPFIR